MAISRREFIRVLGAAGVGALAAPLPLSARAAGGGHVVVVGGGFGGATTAKYIRRLDSSIKVTLVAPERAFTTCPGSNWVIGGLRDMSAIVQRYDALRKRHGVQVVHDTVDSIDADKRRVKLKQGGNLNYDRLVVSPGIDFRFEAIEGYDEAATKLVPHAWKAGPQTALLIKQLEAMPDGGRVVMSSPPDPFRCPPGPYERASMIAHYLRYRKPKSKILILDAKDKFSKQGLFEQGWRELYGYGTDNSLIEWVPLSKDGNVVRVDPRKRIAYTELGDHKADVLNIIPPQKAAEITQRSGLTDETGWCPVDQKTFESSRQPGIHVIGDACMAPPLPKSGYSANSEGKACAFAVVAALQGAEVPEPTWINTCYSLVGRAWGISVAGVYDYKDGKIVSVEGAGGVSPKDGNRKKEAVFAESWYDNIIFDTWG